ncbi:TRAP transporter substrate-binding protein [Photobacterium minamisatsumaniensis]|uniref:TRAP transporter substrate-binding protein n=1 Tax=Photobacterium minamisatsumaniensis TaxID=2910233 RepID=UPI003D0993FE
MSLLKSALLVGATSLLISSWSAVAAPEKVIQISTWGSPNHGINTDVWPTWGQWVEEATEGRVTINVNYDLGPPQSQVDIVTDGIADVSWFFHGLKPGRFKLTQLPEIPLFIEGSSSELVSVAYWRTYDNYLRKGNEHRGVDVLAVGVHGPGQIISRDKVTNVDDLKGKKYRIGGGVGGAIAKDFNVSPISMPPTKVYESLAQGVVDGTFLTLEVLKSFRLHEVAPYTMAMPGGLYRGSFGIVMNKDTLRGVSPEDKAAIMAVSGEKLSRLFGKMMDDADDAGVEAALESGNEFSQAPEAMIEQVKVLTVGLKENWYKTAQKRKVDGEAAYSYYLEELNKELAKQ